MGPLAKQAREEAGLSQVQAAPKLGVDSITLSRWERGKHRIPGTALMAMALLYQKPLSFFGEEAERLGETASIGDRPNPDGADLWEPNPSLKGVVPQRVYDVAIAYCRRLAAAGLPREDIEEAERLLIDEGYAKLNKRAKRVLTEDEQIELIDATWRIMREALSWRGLRA